MEGRKDSNVRLCPKRLTLNALGGIAVAQQAGVERFIAQTSKHVSSERFVQVQVNERIANAVTMQHGRQFRQHARTNESNVE